MPTAKTFGDLAIPSKIPEQTLKFSKDLPDAYRPKLNPEAASALRETISELTQRFVCRLGVHMEVGEEANGRLQTNDRLQEGESIYATYAVP